MCVRERERERERFTSPFSQHWLMRTRLGWSYQPSWEWLLGSGKQPSGPFATQNTAWYHQLHDTTNETGGECGQIERERISLVHSASIGL